MDVERIRIRFFPEKRPLGGSSQGRNRRIRSEIKQKHQINGEKTMLLQKRTQHT